MNAKTPLELTDANFAEQVLSSERPVLVDFWAAWCGPCRALEPIWEQLADRYSGSVKIGKLNVDDHPETAAAWGISSIPTVMLFDQGHVVEKLVGVQPLERYEQMLSPRVAS